MMVLSRGPIFQSVLLAYTYNEDTIITLQKKIDITEREGGGGGGGGREKGRKGADGPIRPSNGKKVNCRSFDGLRTRT